MKKEQNDILQAQINERLHGAGHSDIQGKEQLVFEDELADKKRTPLCLRQRYDEYKPNFKEIDELFDKIEDKLRFPTLSEAVENKRKRQEAIDQEKEA